MENLQNTPNRISCELAQARTDEIRNTLITTFKSSPKSPRTAPVASYNAEKKKSSKKKSSKKSLRQRNRQIAGRPSEIASSDAPRQLQRPVDAPYNLIEFYGDRSELSDKENVANPREDGNGCSDAGSTVTYATAESSDPPRIGGFDPSAAGISVHRTSERVIFVIPEEWASTIEIMRLPVTSGSNPLDQLYSYSPAYEQQANSVGPVRSKGKAYTRNSRSTPYHSSRNLGRDKQNSHYSRANDNGRSNSHRARNGYIPESVKSKAGYYFGGDGYKYEARDYQETSSSVGPIRRSNKRRATYTPYGNSRRRSYNSVDSASTSTSDSFNHHADSGLGFSLDRNSYNYSDNEPYKPIKCWHCCERGHIRVNCPLWRMSHRKR